MLDMVRSMFRVAPDTLEPTSMNGRALPSRARIPGLDVLRACAVAAVVAYHFPRSSGDVVLRALSHFGWSGVDLFFVLSGYLIASQYLAEPAAGKPPQVWRFYARRLMRTLPNYYVMLLICLLLGAGVFKVTWRYITFTKTSVPVAIWRFRGR